MIINFPFSPKVGQIYTQDSLSWQWDGVQWVVYNSVSNGGGITGYTTSSGVLVLGSTGSSANGASTIVTRDADGSFSTNSITVTNGFFDGSLRAITNVVNGGSVTGTIVGNTLTLGGGSGGGATSVVNASGINGVISSSTLTLSVSPGAFANSVTNGGGITGYITGGGVLTLGSNGASANGASTIVTRDAAGNFTSNVITASSINVTSTTTASSATTGALVVAGGIGVGGQVWLGSVGGDEGGQINFSLASTNTTLSGSVVIDVYQNKLRFFESGGTNRGAYIDLTATAAGGATDLLSGGGGGGLAGVSNGGGITGYVASNILYLGSNATSSNISNAIVSRGADGSFITNIITVGGILSSAANGVATIGNSTAYFGNIFGTAMLARYADLAESYSADHSYDPGTVVEFGGVNEITLATNETTRVAGVISTKPAYLMNMDQQGDNMLAVALQGRVPCKVIGVVHKGDMMVSAGDGLAKACSNPVVGTIIGKALENHFSSENGVIEVVVGIR